MSTIEQTLRADERLTRKETCVLIAGALRLKLSTVSKKTIYEEDIAATKASNTNFFKKPELIAALNKRLG